MSPAKENNIYAPNVLTASPRMRYFPHQKPFSQSLQFRQLSQLSPADPMTLGIMNVLNSGNTSNPCGWSQKPRCALGHGEEIRWDHLISCLLIFQWELPSCPTKFLYISHLISFWETSPYHMPYVTSYCIHYHYNEQIHKATSSFPPNPPFLYV